MHDPKMSQGKEILQEEKKRDSRVFFQKLPIFKNELFHVTPIVIHANK